MSCTKHQGLEILVSIAIRDRNSFAKKLSRQRNDPSQHQLDWLKKLADEITDSNENLAQHEASCADCLAPES